MNSPGEEENAEVTPSEPVETLEPTDTDADAESAIAEFLSKRDEQEAVEAEPESEPHAEEPPAEVEELSDADAVEEEAPVAPAPVEDDRINALMKFVEQQQKPAEEKPAEPAPEPEPEFKLSEEFAQDFPSEAKAFEAIQAQNKELRQQIGEVREYIQQQIGERIDREVNAAFDKLDSADGGYAGVFSGDTGKANRDSVIKVAMALEAGFGASGQPVPPPTELVEMATRMKFADKYVDPSKAKRSADASEKAKQQERDTAGRFLGRPGSGGVSSGEPGVPKTGDKIAEDAIRQWQNEHGWK